MRKIGLRNITFILILCFVLTSFVHPAAVGAAPMSGKSVTIGDSTPSATTSHLYEFTLASVGNVGSIELEYCTNTAFVGQPCAAPVDFSASSATLASQTGEGGFSISPLSSVNKIILTRPSVPASAIPVSYRFESMVNPSAERSTVYVRIATYASDDATGPTTDEGAVAFATLSNIAVSGVVPPYLTFCVGVVVALNCTNTTGTLLDFGELITSGPRYLSSQFAVATNDPGGYATTVAGTTMTSGNNIINPLEAPSGSVPGTGQFGMNLRSNSRPSIGAEPIGVGTGAIAAGYNTPNQYLFKNQVVAASTISSDFNAFTVSYIVNVGRDQRPGIYTTTLTYIASAAF